MSPMVKVDRSSARVFPGGRMEMGFAGNLNEG